MALPLCMLIGLKRNRGKSSCSWKCPSAKTELLDRDLIFLWLHIKFAGPKRVSLMVAFESSRPGPTTKPKARVHLITRPFNWNCRRDMVIHPLLHTNFGFEGLWALKYIVGFNGVFPARRKTGSLESTLAKRSRYTTGLHTRIALSWT